MARRLGKRKQSKRSDYMLKEAIKIREGVFDDRTLQRLGKMISKGIISSIEFPISTGKEADVYFAYGGEALNEDFVAVKIFRTETSSFFKRTEYMLGDPRFPKINRNINWIVTESCKKEFGNLKIAGMAKVHAPEAYSFYENVLAMEFIGVDGKVAPQLKKIEIKDPKKVFKTIINDIKKLYENELVHADVSEYNILMKGDVPYMIDFGQAVITQHPNSLEFLKRDIRNITDYFNDTYDLGEDTEELFRYVTTKKI